uniref:Transposable element P transposase-like GTP-binding insertion domain-containing protein n=1 Tax=Strigamia maritima TaxID=126957 RepID=T1ILE0_STRMM
MSAKLSLQLFSRSTADGIQFYREQKFKRMEGSEATEKFTRTLNNLLKEFYTSLFHGNNDIASPQTMETLKITLKSRHFGLIRGISPNDHPTIISFLQLHQLQAIYIPVKGILSSAANSEDQVDQFLTAYVKDLRMLARGSWTENANKQTEVLNSIKSKIVHANASDEEDNGDVDEIIDKELDVLHDFNYNLAQKNNCITYYLTGFILTKAKKFTQCNDCILSLSTTNQFAKFSALTKLKDFGSFLNYPSENFYNLFLQIEKLLEPKLKKEDLSPDLFFEILNDINEIKITSDMGCSEEHAEELVPKFVQYYIQTRMFFKTREMRRKSGSRVSSKANRKLSKLR